ncbi:MAG: ABC transporter permease, partial [Betaproteobacteria bacterium]
MTRSLRAGGYRYLAGRALSADAWHANRGRLLLSIIGVALGVALGIAVHLINGSAMNEFDVAARTLSGDADLIVRGADDGFDEEVYPRIARIPGVDIASPALELDVRIPGRKPLRWAGIDVFRALAIQPGLLGNFTQIHELLVSDAVLLTHAAAADLGLAAGAELTAQVGTSLVRLRVIAVLPTEASAQRMAFADIATTQWRLQRTGVVNRIDVRLVPGADVRAVRYAIASVLPEGVHVTDPEAQSRET